MTNDAGVPMLTIRLPDDLESQLKALTELENKTRTEIVKAALAEYARARLGESTPYELGADLFGKHASGEGDLSTTYKARIAEKLREKRSH